MFCKRNVGFFPVLLVLLVATIASGQVSTSRIEGTVIDNSNAVIPNADVRATNEGTGVSYDVKTSSSGTYAIPSLTPGQYTITVTVTGFQTFTSQHNVLSV